MSTMLSAHQHVRHAKRRSPSAKPPAERKPRKPRTPKAPKAPLLAPLNPIEVAEPGTSGETLNQKRLREFYELQQVYFDVRDRYFARYKQVQDLLIHGANVQTGTYKVRSGVRLVRRPKYKQVVIDLKGEQFQQRVLENTQPHAHFIVRIE